MNKARGIRDLMESQRYKIKHLSKALKDGGVPGNWDSTQNLYNLANGEVVPKDAYAYVIMAKMLDVDVGTILNRYSAITIVNEEAFTPNIVEVIDIPRDNDLDW
jgi:hypothetical protein